MDRKREPGKGCISLFLILLSIIVIGFTVPTVSGELDNPDDSLAVKIREMVTSVHCVSAGLGALASDENYVDLLRKFIEPIRFFSDLTGYFFIYDINGVVIAHAADKKLVGKNLYNLQDKTGKYFIRDKIAAAEKGGGFVTYYWPDPTTKEIKKKQVYVEMIPGTKYLIGSGVYLE